MDHNELAHPQPPVSSESGTETQPTADTRLADQIWQRYGVAPGVIPLPVTVGIFNRINRFAISKVPLLAQVQRRGAAVSAFSRGASGLPYVWPDRAGALESPLDTRSGTIAPRLRRELSRTLTPTSSGLGLQRQPAGHVSGGQSESMPQSSNLDTARLPRPQDNPNRPMMQTPSSDAPSTPPHQRGESSQPVAGLVQRVQAERPGLPLATPSSALGVAMVQRQQSGPVSWSDVSRGLESAPPALGQAPVNRTVQQQQPSSRSATGLGDLGMTLLQRHRNGPGGWMMQPTPVSSDLVPTPQGAPTGETAHQLGIQATVASTEASSLKAEATHASQLGVQILQRHLTTPIGRMSAQSNAHAEVQAKTTETAPVRGLEQPLFPAGADGREATGADMAKRFVSVLPVAFPTPTVQGALGGEQANALGVQRGKTATSHADERRVQILQRHPPGPTEQMLQAKMADSPAQAANRENGRQALRQAQGPLTAGPRTELVEVQTPAPTVLVQRQSVAGANVGANIPLPLAIHTNQGNPSMIARQDTGTPGSLNEANSLPAQNFAATPVETPADIDVGELAEQVSRILMRQLDVERERRGGGRWH